MNYTTYDNTNFKADMDGESGFSSPLMTFAAVMTFIIMVVGIFGNFLTIVALVKCPKVRNVAAAFIISLCLADLIFCALVLPFSGFRYVQGKWNHGEFLCKLIPFIQYGNIGVSLLCIAMITINRYVMIAHHSCYSKIYSKHCIAAMIAFCWLFSYGMQLPTLLGVWGTFAFDSKLGTCSIMPDANGNSSKTWLFIIAFIIPCVIIIICYTKIFMVVHKSELRLKQHANKQNSIPNNLRPTPVSSAAESRPNRTSSGGSDSSFSTDIKPEALQKPSRVKDEREIRAKRNEWRITKMVLAIFLSFVICYLPITIAKVADKDVNYPSFHICSYILLYLSACINPIIYVIMNKQYRKAYKTVLMCEPSKLLPFVKPTGGSSAAEMERYRIEPQPQPYNGVTNVGGRSAKYQLKQFSTAAVCIGNGDDSGKAVYEKPIRSHCADRHNNGSGEPTCHSNNARGRPYKQWVRPHNGASNHYTQFASASAAKSEQGVQSNSFGGRRYYSGRGGRRGCYSDSGPPPSGSQPTAEEQLECIECGGASEENPILWTKYKRHSR